MFTLSTPLGVVLAYLWAFSTIYFTRQTRYLYNSQLVNEKHFFLIKFPKCALYGVLKTAPIISETCFSLQKKLTGRRSSPNYHFLSSLYEYYNFGDESEKL